MVITSQTAITSNHLPKCKMIIGKYPGEHSFCRFLKQAKASVELNHRSNITVRRAVSIRPQIVYRHCMIFIQHVNEQLIWNADTRITITSCHSLTKLTSHYFVSMATALCFGIQTQLLVSHHSSQTSISFSANKSITIGTSSSDSASINGPAFQSMRCVSRKQLINSFGGHSHVNAKMQ